MVCIAETYQPGSPVIMFGLLPCEQLMSVLHFSIKRDVNCTDTIKSKTRLVFQVGFRRFSACPIFSQHGRGDKHKVCSLSDWPASMGGETSTRCVACQTGLPAWAGRQAHKVCSLSDWPASMGGETSTQCVACQTSLPAWAGKQAQGT